MPQTQYDESDFVGEGCCVLFVEQRPVGLISPDTDFVWDKNNPTFRISTNLRTIDPHV